MQAIDFDIGRFIVKNRRASFQFNHEIVMHQNNPQLAVGNATIEFGGEDKSGQAAAVPHLDAAGPSSNQEAGSGSGAEDVDEPEFDNASEIDKERAELLQAPAVPEVRQWL